MTKEWYDDTMKMANHAYNCMINIQDAIHALLKERSWLYGIIIYLMVINNLKEVPYPSPELLRSYGKTFYVLLNSEANPPVIELKEQEDAET